MEKLTRFQRRRLLRRMWRNEDITWEEHAQWVLNKYKKIIPNEDLADFYVKSILNKIPPYELIDK